MQETILAVGAQASGSNAGAALVFEYLSATGTWTQLGDMLSGEADGDHFGVSVALSGDGSTVAVGGYFHDGGDQGSLPNAGHVRVFSFTNQQWMQLGQDIDGVAEQDRAGERVAISHNGRTVAVAAVLHDGVGGPNSGHVRILDYDNDAAVWSQRGSDMDGEDRLDQSGSGIAIYQTRPCPLRPNEKRHWPGMVPSPSDSCRRRTCPCWEDSDSSNPTT